MSTVAIEVSGGFHNATVRRFRAVRHGGGVYALSAAQSAALRRHLCGISDCRCEIGAAEYRMHGERIAAPEPDADATGRECLRFALR